MSEGIVVNTLPNAPTYPATGRGFGLRSRIAMVAPRLIGRLRVVATYDVFPEFSSKVRRIVYNPLGVLVLAALAAFICGLFLHAQGLVLGGGIIAVILLGVVWPCLTLRGLHGTISFEQVRVCEGDRVAVILTLRNRWPWSAVGLAMRDDVGSMTAPGRSNGLVASIASASGRRMMRCRWSFVPGCRGVYPRSAPRLATGFPFGLWESARLVSVERQLLVWPRTFPVGPMPLTDGDQLVEGNVTRNRVGSNGDVLGVRPYRRGDSPRRIHWSQSARHDRLIVCELQSNTRPVIQLVLDADPRVHSGDGQDGSREWAIRIVASLAKGWLEAGVQVGAVWGGQVIPPASGQRHLHCLLDGLARLPDGRGPSLAETLAEPGCRGFSDGLQVIVTTDLAWARVERPHSTGKLRRWVVLRTAAFGESREVASTSPVGSPGRPWLWIDSVEHIPALLRGGRKEARHGT
jgi:uncharacterized protein (DUF58 family)